MSILRLPRHAEKIGPLFDQVPDVPVGEMGVFGRAGEFSGFSDLVEDPEHHHRGLRAALFAKSPDGLDLDIQHVFLDIMNFISYVCEA